MFRKSVRSASSGKIRASAAKEAMSSFIKSFKVVPIMLFRINTGNKIKLRDLALKTRGSYDVSSEAGMVQPKALDPSTYTGKMANIPVERRSHG